MPGRIPRRWDAVTPAWAEWALGDAAPGAKVAAVRLVTDDDGTNRRARFAIDYARGQGPATVFVKAHAASHRWVHFRNGNLWVEARLFASGVPLMAEHPRVYRAVIDRLRLDFLIVMEDLAARDADMRDATRPLTPDQVAAGLRELAALHARYWNLARRSEPRLGWVKTWAPFRGYEVGLAARVPTGLARLAGQLPASVERLGADGVLDAWRRYVTTLAHGPVTLLHGDAHIGNSYVLPDGRVGFLDWTVRRGGWSQDVGYFIVGALTEDDRRTHARALLEAYRAALDVPDRPDADAIWRGYRASHAFGLAIWASTMGTDGWQSKAICTALTRRYAAAFAEDDTLGAIAALEA